MKYPKIILILFIVSASFNAHSQDATTRSKNNLGRVYDYIIEMPDFMVGYPETVSNQKILWGWQSRDRKNYVSHSVVKFPKKALKAPEVLNEALGNHKLLRMTPKFIKAGQKRFISENKKENIWEIAIADETPDQKCQVAIFWVHGGNPDRTYAILKALRNGSFGIRDASFYREITRRHNLMEVGNPGVLSIELHVGGEIKFEGKELPQSKMTQITREWIDKMKEEPYNNLRPRLLLRADKKCKTEDVKAVVEAAAKEGLVDVIFKSVDAESSK